MPPLVGGGIRSGICGGVVVRVGAADRVPPTTPPAVPLGVMLPPLQGRGGDEQCMLKRLPPTPLPTPPPPLHASELSEEGDADVSAVGGEGGDEAELVGDVAADRMAECAAKGWKEDKQRVKIIWISNRVKKNPT